METSNEQKRAIRAWELVDSIPDDRIEKYSSLAKSAPVMILTNGLGQTLAYFISKSNGANEYSLLYNHLNVWLSENVVWSAGNTEKRELIERVINENTYGYRMATEEALAFLSWIKRFAGAKDSNNDEGDK